MGNGVCCICVMRGVGGGGRVVANTRGGSMTPCVTLVSTTEVKPSFPCAFSYPTWHTPCGFRPISLSDDDIENKDSYEPALLVTLLFDANKDECFDPGGDIDEIDAFLDIDVSTDVKDGYHDSEGDIIYFESLLMNNTIPNLPSEVFLDHDPRSLKDEPNFVDMVQVFDPGIHEKSYSLTFVKLTFEDRHYFPITFVIQIFLPYLTYSVDSSFLLSSGSTDIGKITRKWSKPDKHGHENGKSAQEPEVSSKAQQSQPRSTLGQPTRRQNP
ncbi:hypothetical protein Tco_1129274 [Tanacetum coccineum]